MQTPTHCSNGAQDFAPQSHSNGARPIACATDFSPTATDAVDVAGTVAQRLGTNVLLLHVVSAGAKDSVHFETLLSEKREQLEAEAARLRKRNVRVEQKLLCGSVFEELIKTAAEQNARLLLVGAVGHGLARRLLVGSVAERVAQTSTVPTVVVRPNSALVRWAREQRPLKVVVGYDFSLGSAAALACARELKGIAGCETHVIHIDGNHDADQRVEFNGIAVTHTNGNASSSIERELKMRVAQVLSGDEVSTSVFAGWHRADAHLLEIARERGADLVIVGSRATQHVHYGSAPRALLHHGELSLAVARATAPPAREKQLPKFDRVLIATAANEPSGDAAVRFGCALVNRGGQLKILQLPGKRNGSGIALRPKTIREVRSLLPKKSAEEYDIHLDVCLSDEPVRGIAHEAEQFRADVICVDAPKGNGNGDAALLQQLIATTHRPVLVLPAQT